MVVDDDPQMLRYLPRVLDTAGYQSVVTSVPSEVIGLLEIERPDMVLLDLVLPGISGFDLLGQIREQSGVPVICVTARDTDEDAVRALRSGADDYVTKPFSPSELVARIETCLRRRTLPDQTEGQPSLVLNDLTIDFADRCVTREGRVISLTATEYKVLYELASYVGRVLTHDQILERVWGPEYTGDRYLVRSMVRRLRRKLGDDARRPRYILTEPNVGYRLAKP